MCVQGGRSTDEGGLRFLFAPLQERNDELSIILALLAVTMPLCGGTLLLVAHFLLATSPLLFLKTNPVRWLDLITHYMDTETTALGMWVSCSQTPRCDSHSRIPAHHCLATKSPPGYIVLPSPSCMHSPLGLWHRTRWETSPL